MLNELVVDWSRLATAKATALETRENVMGKRLSPNPEREQVPSCMLPCSSTKEAPVCQTSISSIDVWLYAFQRSVTAMSTCAFANPSWRAQMHLRHSSVSTSQYRSRANSRRRALVKPESDPLMDGDPCCVTLDALWIRRTLSSWSTVKNGYVR